MPVLAVAQMTATSDVDENLRTAAGLVARAKAAGAALVSLPECFAFMGAGDGEVVARMEPLEGALLGRYRALAQEQRVWLSLGGFPERGPDAGHAYNTHVIVDDAGVVRASYRKVHLFDVDLPGMSYHESSATTAGDSIVVVDSPVGRLGLSICYDLRFPELYLALAKRGAEVLLVPAAFTLATGKDHWEPLLRARAIETQCYVAAAAQVGQHNPKRATWGHAMTVDPWGAVVAQASDGPGIAIAEIDFERVRSVRARVPVWKHRRSDVYGKVGVDDETR